MKASNGSAPGSTRHDLTVDGPEPYRATRADDPVRSFAEVAETTVPLDPAPDGFDPDATAVGPDPIEPGFQVTLNHDADGVDFASPTRPTADPTLRRHRGPLPAIPGYEVLGELGRGGMGVVYLARQVRLNRPCALKMILAGDHASPATARRFRAEAETIARLHHPNIVQVYHVDDHDGRPYLELEYVERGSLAGRLDGTPWPARDAARLVATLARAIAVAHRLGIIHRDLKPGNVLIAADGTPKITDFGIAKSLETLDPITRTEAILGSPSYMAPEQAAGHVRQVGAAADVYALGAVLYELLTGRPPFRAATALETLEQVKAVPVVPPSRLQPALARDIETICLKCLQKEPARRYDSAAALAEDLRRFDAGEPILARRTSPWERLWLWCLRNPALAGLTATVVVLLIAASLGSTLAAVRFRRVATQAEQAQRRAERTLADMQTAQGLMASERGQAADALLWFAHAARLARDDSGRALANRVRAQSWGRQVGLPVLALPHEGRPLKSLAFRPGGGHLLTLTHEGHGQVWDLATGAPLPWPPGEAPISAACWSPDGAWLALAGADGEVEIRAVPSGAVAHRLPARGAVTALAFRPDGQFLVVAGEVVRLWDCRSSRFTGGEWPHPRPVHSLAFSPRGDRLATACRDGQARLFPLPGAEATPVVTSSPLSHAPAADSAPTIDAAPAFVDDGRGLVTITGHHQATWWDTETGRAIKTLTFPGIGNLRFVVASPDGRSFALVGWSGAQTWRTAEGGRPGKFLAHRHLATAAAFSADGATLLTVSNDRTGRLWSWPQGDPIGNPLPHQDNVALAAISSDGLFLATAQNNGLVRVWRRPAGQPDEHRLTCDPGNLVLNLGPDGRHAIAGRYQRFGWSYDARRTRVYDVTNGQPAGPSLNVEGPLRDAVLSPDGRTAATICAEGASGLLQCWDVHTGRPRSAPRRLPSLPEALAYHPRGTHLAVICRGGEVVVTDGANAREVLRFAHPDAELPDHPITVRYTPDGATLVTVGPDSTVIAWDAATGKRRFQIKPGSTRTDVAIAPDGRFLATGVRDGRLRVWHLADGRPATEVLRHPDWVFQVRFSPDGRRLLTACRDGQARLWDWEAGRLVCPPFRHDDEVWGVAFTPDGRWVLTTGRDNTLRTWESVTGKPVAPPLALGGQGTNVEVTPDGRRAVVGVVGPAPRSVSLDDLASANPLGPDDLCTLGELASGQRVVDSDLAGLTTDEWLERWRAFLLRHPRHGAEEPREIEARQRQAVERLLAARRWPEAIAHLRALVALRPDDATARVALSRAYERLGRGAEAATEMAGAADRAADAPAAWVALGRHHAERGETAKAEAAFARAAALAPDDPNVFLDAGWWVVGPYDEDLAAAGPPESDPDPSRPVSGSGSTGPQPWRSVPTGPNGLVDLGAEIGRAEHVSAYALAYVYTRSGRPARLLIGSDDTVRVWLNGELVHEHAQPRAATPEQDRVPVVLAPGRNTVLIKVGNTIVDHLFYLRIGPEPTPAVDR